MAEKIRKRDVLHYHEWPRPGKIEVVPTKKTKSQRDLSLAYSPGVAEPCLEIAKRKSDVFKYTAKGNLVAVISNGTAVLGLGNIRLGMAYISSTKIPVHRLSCFKLRYSGLQLVLNNMK